MTWLIACLMLAVASLLYVFYLAGRLFVGMATTRAGHLRERKGAFYEGLRDLNFEYIAGKVPDADYASLNVLCGAKPPPYWSRSPLRKKSATAIRRSTKV